MEFVNIFEFNKMDPFKKGALFAFGFLTMIATATIALAAYVYVSEFPSTAGNGSTLSSWEWNKIVAALQSLDMGIQKSACEGRRGVWSGNACQEYAYYGSTTCAYGSCTCDAGYHKCSFPDLFSGGFDSLRRPGYNQAVGGYGWIAGSYVADQNSFFYAPWVGSAWGSPLTCGASSHYMMDLRRNANGNTAWWCYNDSYNSAVALCCRDNQ